MTLDRSVSVALLIAFFFALLCAAPFVQAQQPGEDDVTATPTAGGTPMQRELPKGVPGPDVLKRRLENLRVPKGATTTGRETPIPGVTGAAATVTPTPTPTPTPAAATNASTLTTTAKPTPESTSIGTGLIQTNPKSQKALPWNMKVTLGQIDDTDLEEVIRTISRATARNFIYDKKDVRNQKVTILTPTALTVGEAYQAFQTALEGAGLTLVQVGPNLIRIIPRRDAAQKPLDTDGGTSVPWNDSFVTRMIRLQNSEVTQIQGILQQLSSKDGAQVQAFAPTNTLILTDTANNIRRLAKIIEELDRSGGEENISVIKIKHADVNNVADQIQQLFGTGQAAGAAGAPAGGRPGARRGATLKGTPGTNIPGMEGSAAAGAAGGESAPLVSKVIPDQRTNQIIVVGNDRALLALQDFLEKIDILQDEGANIHVYYLENADAEELATVLANLAQGNAGGGGAGAAGGGRGRNTTVQPGGMPQQPAAAGSTAAPVAVLEGDVKITSDKATNALVITASKSDFAALKQVIQKLDIRRQQVYVEAVILELTVTKSRDLGMSFLGGADVGDGAIGFGGLNAGNVLNPASFATGFALGLIGPGGVTLDFPDGTGGTVPVLIPPFGVVLTALQRDSEVNVLSRPNILAKENEEAEIIVATAIAVPGTSTISQTGLQNFSITHEDVGITLKVTPKINESDHVSLKLFQEVKSIVKDDRSNPAQRLVDTGKRSASTNVVVKNGETVVIGGLLSDEDGRQETKIPLLGDIPFLGWLFRSSSKTASKTNLLIFLTPTIINDDSDMKLIYEKRIRERDQFLKLYGNRSWRNETKRKLTLFERYYGEEAAQDKKADKESRAEEKKRKKDQKNQTPPLIFEPVRPIEEPKGTGEGTTTDPAANPEVSPDPNAGTGTGTDTGTGTEPTPTPTPEGAGTETTP